MEETKKEELAIARRLRDGKYNLVGENGNYLFNEWFDWLDYFYSEFAIVRRENHEYNYIDKNGKFLFKEWFKWLDLFKDGFARVKRGDGLMNFIDKKGKILSNEWFRYVDCFYEYGLAVVERTNGEWCKIDKTGKIVKSKRNDRQRNNKVCKAKPARGAKSQREDTKQIQECGN